MNKSSMILQLNSITKLDNDPTIIPCKMVVLDFEKSRKGVTVSKETALEGAKTLKNKPITAKYFENTSQFIRNDNFGDHEVKEKIDNDGNLKQFRDTIAIGTFVSEGYIEEIEFEGEKREAMVADGQLWYTKYPEACDLLMDWHDRGIDIHMSSEYSFVNYAEIDGEIHHLSPIIFEAHTILGSEDRGERTAVSPAYGSSKMQLALNDLNSFDIAVAKGYEKEARNSLTEEEKKALEEQEKLDNEKKEEVVDPVKTEDENKDDKKDPETETDEEETETETTKTEETQSQLNALSHDEIREAIRTQAKEEFGNQWVYVNLVYDDHAIVEVEDSNDYSSSYHRFGYTVDDNDNLILDKSSKKEVVRKVEFVEKNNEIQTVLNSTVEKLGEANEQITQLNATIDELNKFKEMHEESVANEQLETQLNTFQEKFNKFGLMEQFNSEEVQGLIKKSINDNDEGKEALLQINSILVDSFDASKIIKNNGANNGLVLNSYTREKIEIVPKDNSFEAIYGKQ